MARMGKENEMDDYVLSLKDKYDITWYWQGKGKFTKHLEFAKTYPTWQKASHWSHRIKRWQMKYSTIREEQLSGE